MTDQLTERHDDMMTQSDPNNKTENMMHYNHVLYN